MKKFFYTTIALLLLNTVSNNGIVKADATALQQGDFKIAIVDNPLYHLAKIVEYTGSKEKLSNEFPETVEYNDLTYKVYAIDNNVFANNETLISVYLPDYIQLVGEGCFQNCKNLKEIILTAENIQIGKDAFADTPFKMLCINSVGIEGLDDAFGENFVLEDAVVRFGYSTFQTLSDAGMKLLNEQDVVNIRTEAYPYKNFEFYVSLDEDLDNLSKDDFYSFPSNSVILMNKNNNLLIGWDDYSDMQGGSINIVWPTFNDRIYKEDEYHYIYNADPEYLLMDYIQISNITKNSEFHVTANESSEVVSLEQQNNNEVQEVFDITGKRISTQSDDISLLPPGIYLVKKYGKFERILVR